MSKFLASKAFPGRLAPVDAMGEAALSKIKSGTVVEVEIKQPRNVKHHRMFWALMSIVWDNLDQEKYPTVEDVAAAVKISAGLRTRIELPSGEVGFIPGSIAFAKMDQAQFSEFYERVCDLVARHFLPGVSKAELRSEVEQMIGMAA
jgi:hypothetical protein